MRIGILVAMHKEYEQLRSLCSSYKEEIVHNIGFGVGRIGDKEIILGRCGIGKVNAAIGAMEMIYHYSPDLIVSTGVAGSINSYVHVGEVVVGTSYAYHDVFCGDDCEQGKIPGMPRIIIPRHETTNADFLIAAHLGQIVSGDQFVKGKDAMNRIKSDFPEALAVDMESCAIAHVCIKFGVPFVSFRIISDELFGKNNAAQYENFWEQLANKSFSVIKEYIQVLKKEEE